MANPTRKRATYRERYQGSARQAANERIARAIYDALLPIAGADIAFDWRFAWFDMVAKSGRNIGLPPSRKPSSKRDPDGVQSVLWEAWNHARGDAEAGRFGLIAHMSLHGAMASLMFCRAEYAREAFDACGRAVAAEYTAQRKKSA